MKVFGQSTNASFIKSWPTGVGLGHNRETVFTCLYVGKYFKNLLVRNHWARKAEIQMKAI
jgi:hypothetical protein